MTANIVGSRPGQHQTLCGIELASVSALFAVADFGPHPTLLPSDFTPTIAPAPTHVMLLAALRWWSLRNANSKPEV